MNNYSVRAQYYKYEFNTIVDFPLLESLLLGTNGPIAEIPCGSGRLIPLHLKHQCKVYMIDREKAMTLQCKNVIVENQISHRVFSIVGDLVNWTTHTLLQLVLIPMGGLQLLINENDVKMSISNLAKNVAKRGLVYIDISCPWKNNLVNPELLPEFMRFNGSKHIIGESIFEIDDGRKLYRKYDSLLEEHNVHVRLSYKVESNTMNGFTNYSSEYTWRRIELSNLQSYLFNAGFEVMKLYGNYHFDDYEDNSPRLICIAKKLI